MRSERTQNRKFESIFFFTKCDDQTDMISGVHSNILFNLIF